MSQPNVCTADGGLINPAALPARSADLDTTLITGAADDLRAMGSSVDTKTDEIKAVWNGLTGCYEAPEQSLVYALMTDPATASQDVKDTFGKMAGHLDTYAEALDTIKPKLADFEKRAQEFRDDVIDGVWVDATEASDAGLGTYVEAGWNWATGQDQERKKVPWYEDGDTVEKNKNFIEEIGGIYAEVSSAAATCATSINGLTSLPPDKKKVEPIPAEAFYNSEMPMPWGSAREEERNCPESVGHGAYQFGKNTLEGLGQLISYNPETGDWGDWGHAGQAWMGMGNVLMSLAVSTNPAVLGLNASLKLTGQGDSAVSQWLDERNTVSATVVGSLVGIDLNAKDPFHKWKEDGVATFTESTLNVGTFFIPGAGQAGAAVKVAGLGSKLARITGAVAEFAVPGGSWLMKGGLHTIPVLRNVIRFTDEVPVNLVDDAAAGSKVPTFNPASALDRVDDVVPSRPAERPVSDSLFGDERPPVRPDEPEPPVRTNEPEPPVKPEEPEPPVKPEEPEPPVKPEEPAPPVRPEEPEPNGAHDPDGHSENPGEAPDGGPTHDRYGREYGFTDDGRRTLPGDPDNTYRDVTGALHDGDGGKYATDPNKPQVEGVEYAQKGEPHDAVLDPADQAAHDALVDARSNAQAAAQEASARLDQLAVEAGVDPKVLKGSPGEVGLALRELRAAGIVDSTTTGLLRDAAMTRRETALILNRASERLGDEATAAVSRSRGDTSLVDTPRAGAGRFDHVAVGGEPPHLTFYESKGGNSSLGFRTVDGVKVQQGTTTYLNAIAEIDSRAVDGVRSYLTNSNADPALVKALQNGTIDVRYELVQAKPNGTVKVTAFVVDPHALRLPKF